MDISGIGASGGLGLGALGGGLTGAAGEAGFGDLLQSMIGNLDETQARADEAVKALALGEDIDIHEVVLATELEALAFQFALQVRNKFVETVQTVMNMQV